MNNVSDKAGAADAFRWYRWAADIARRPDLSAGAKLLAHVYARHADNTTGECWPSRELLADAMGVSTRRVTAYRRELLAAGVLHELTKGAHGKAPRVRLTETAGKVDTSDHLRPQAAPAKVDTSDHLGGRVGGQIRSSKVVTSDHPTTQRTTHGGTLPSAPHKKQALSVGAAESGGPTVEVEAVSRPSLITEERAHRLSQRCVEVGIPGPTLKAELRSLGVLGFSKLTAEQADRLEAWIETQEATTPRPSRWGSRRESRELAEVA